MAGMKSLFKFVYNIIPFKKYFFQVLKKVYSPPKNIYQHLYFNGIFSVNIDAKNTFKIKHFGYQIENELFWNGVYNGWEKNSLNIWIELCSKSNVIFDIGANTGIYSLVAKTLNSSSKVYAFEPVDRVFQKLVYNNEINSYDIFCIKKAVSNSVGSAKIYDKDTEHTYSVTVNKDLSDNTETSIEVEIETTTIDTFIKENNINHIDLLKIDVETHEVEVLEGFKNYIEKFEPTMLIEILNDEIAVGIEEIISNINYNFYNIDENKGIRQVQNLSKSDYYNFLICKPEIANSIKILKELNEVYK